MNKVPTCVTKEASDAQSRTSESESVPAQASLAPHSSNVAVVDDPKPRLCIYQDLTVPYLLNTQEANPCGIRYISHVTFGYKINP